MNRMAKGMHLLRNVNQSTNMAEDISLSCALEKAKKSGLKGQKMEEYIQATALRLAAYYGAYVC